MLYSVPTNFTLYTFETGVVELCFCVIVCFGILINGWARKNIIRSFRWTKSGKGRWSLRRQALVTKRHASGD